MKDMQLFVYGTIGDPEFFECLLKRRPKYKLGQLSGFGLFVNPESGYLFIKPDAGSTVTGKLVTISQKEVEILDLWENVPYYQREKVSIHCNQRIEEAFVYTQNEATGITINNGALKNRASMLEDIRAFRKWIDDQFEK